MFELEERLDHTELLEKPSLWRRLSIVSGRNGANVKRKTYEEQPMHDLAKARRM